MQHTDQTRITTLICVEDYPMRHSYTQKTKTKYWRKWK